MHNQFLPNEFTLGPMAQAMLVRHDRTTTHNKFSLEPNGEGSQEGSSHEEAQISR
jgi:hypothetical protein